MRKPGEKELAEFVKEGQVYAERHGFRIPYDGSNNYYDNVDVKASMDGFMAGAKYGYEFAHKQLMELVEKDFMDRNPVANKGQWIELTKHKRSQKQTRKYLFVGKRFRVRKMYVKDNVIYFQVVHPEKSYSLIGNSRNFEWKIVNE